MGCELPEGMISANLIHIASSAPGAYTHQTVNVCGGDEMLFMRDLIVKVKTRINLKI